MRSNIFFFVNNTKKTDIDNCDQLSFQTQSVSNFNTNFHKNDRTHSRNNKRTVGSVDQNTRDWDLVVFEKKKKMKRRENEIRTTMQHNCRDDDHRRIIVYCLRCFHLCLSYGNEHIHFRL